MDPFGGIGLGIIRGPSRQYGAVPDLRAGVVIGARNPLGLHLEGRLESTLRHRVIDAQGTRAWRSEEALGLFVGVRVRLRSR
jgi:hypothetical protein